MEGVSSCVYLPLALGPTVPARPTAPSIFPPAEPPESGLRRVSSDTLKRLQTGVEDRWTGHLAPHTAPAAQPPPTAPSGGQRKPTALRSRSMPDLFGHDPRAEAEPMGRTDARAPIRNLSTLAVPRCEAGTGEMAGPAALVNAPATGGRRLWRFRSAKP